jgi:hypothetical protein
VMLWHVCGTPDRSPAKARSDRLSLDGLTRDFVSAPSAIRRRDLLLRRHSRPNAMQTCDYARQARAENDRQSFAKRSSSPPGMAARGDRRRSGSATPTACQSASLC